MRINLPVKNLTGYKVFQTCFLMLLLPGGFAYAQPSKNSLPGFSVLVLNEKSRPVNGATVKLLKDSLAIKTAVTDAKGIAQFVDVADGAYAFSVSFTGYKPQVTGKYLFPSTVNTATVTLQPAATVLQEVNVRGHKPYIEQKQGKVILNVDASVTNVGTTVLEVLEKSPGVSVDRNGGISLQGKPGVLVTIDDKPTYLSAADLNNLLSSMSSSQVDQIELIANPSAKYDASGNAGIINIKTKKNRAKGFNGSFSVSAGQGVYSKTGDNLALNYRSGKFNTFFNYNVNAIGYFTNIYALRKYYDDNGTLISMLEQPGYLKGDYLNNTIKTGVDYDVTPKTTIGIVFSGTAIHRTGDDIDRARWLDAAGALDSTITTHNKNDNHFKNGSISLSAAHTINASQDISADAAYLHYAIGSEQDFNNSLPGPGGYDELSRGNIPTIINIESGKVDYTLRPGKNSTFQAGWKSSFSNTDNSALYQNFDDGQWVEDDTKSNHFIYKENIHALYTSLEEKSGSLTIQAGVRYEHTGYNASQLGNAVQKDTAFSRSYGGFFPSGYISYQTDTANNFTFSAGRRIDRPPFQSLNPFYFIINKYTYETGNPYILPQYTWNITLSHQYKDLLTSSISYSVISNYFSQLFLNYNAAGILLYSQGNVGHTYIYGVSEALALSPVKWWAFNLQAVFNHKNLAGFNGNNYSSYINQLNLNLSSQFTIAKTYTAEITGVYTTRARNDIQELLYPTGQLSVGIAKPVMKKRATLKFSVRDIFYTSAMEGLTQFPNATEYFKETRDTRVYTLSFTYRFGKAYKTVKRGDNSASDEADRVGNG